MHIIRETEKNTQERVIEFFQDALNYTYLGNWADSVDENSNIIPEDLTDWLRRQGNDPHIVNRAVYQLQQTAKIGGSRTLYDANLEVYDLLRYGVKVQPDVSEQHETVWLIDWNNPEKQRLRYRGGGRTQRKTQQTPRSCAIYQRHRNRCVRVETFHRLSF